MEKQTYTPIEKREIRGLTAENIIKYGILVVMALFGYFTMQKKIDNAETKNAEQDTVIQLLKVNVETNTIKIQTIEITAARLQERIDQNTARIKNQ